MSRNLILKNFKLTLSLHTMWHIKRRTHKEYQFSFLIKMNTGNSHFRTLSTCLFQTKESNQLDRECNLQRISEEECFYSKTSSIFQKSQRVLNMKKTIKMLSSVTVTSYIQLILLTVINELTLTLLYTVHVTHL